MTEVTHILEAVEAGDERAAERLLPLVYEELRRLARHWLARERPGQTLEATALVHEAYLRLVTPPKSPPSQGGDAEGVHWNSRGHFFAAAAEAMRRILVEQARHKATAKAGGRRRRVPLANVEPALRTPPVDVLALNEALGRLESEDPRAASVVKLRYFAGLTIPQVAMVLGVSRATVENDWTFAKCALRLQLEDDDADSRQP